MVLVWLSTSILFTGIGALLEYVEERRLAAFAAAVAERKQRITQLESETPKQAEQLRMLHERIDQASDFQRRAESELSVLLEEIQQEGAVLNGSPEFAELSEAQSAAHVAELAAKKAKEQVDAAADAKQEAQKRLTDLKKALERATVRSRVLERDPRSYSTEKKKRAEAEADGLKAAIDQAAADAETGSEAHSSAQERLESATGYAGSLRNRLRAAAESYDKKRVRHISLTGIAEGEKAHVSKLLTSLRDLEGQYSTLNHSRIADERELGRLRQELDPGSSPQNGFGGSESEGTITDLALTGLHGWIAVLIFTSVTAFLAVFCTVQPEWVLFDGVTPARSLLLFGVISGALLLSFAISRSTAAFYSNLGILTILYGPLIILSLFEASVLTFIAMITVAFVASFVVAERGQSGEARGGAIKILYVIWVVTGILATLYKEGLFPAIQVQSGEATAVVADYFRRFDEAVDIRYAATFLLLTAIIAKAITIAFRLMPPPQIRHLPTFLLLSPHGLSRQSIFHAFVEPFLITYNLLIRLAHTVVDTLWYISATVVAYVARIGKSAGNIIFEATLKTRVWPNILRLFGCYVLIYAFCRGLASSSGSVLRYLRQDLVVGSFFSTPPTGIHYVSGFALAGLLGGVCYSWLFWPTEHMRNYLHREAFGTAVGLVLYFSAGVVVYVLASTRILAIRGFGHFGPFTLFVALLLIVFAGGQLVLRVSRRGQPS
jgi:hypothetical protein